LTVTPTPTAAAVVAALLLVASFVPSRVRGHARAILLGAAILAPPAAVGALLARHGRGEPGTWLLLFPLTFAWLAFIDLRFGVAARLARLGARAGRHDA
jgi:hypothetical protein